MKKILWFPIFLLGFNSLLLAQTPNYFNITVQLKDGKNILRDNIVTSLQVTVSPDNDSKQPQVIASATTNYDGYVDLKINTDGLDWTIPNKKIRITGIPERSTPSSKEIELAKDILLPVSAYSSSNFVSNSFHVRSNPGSILKLETVNGKGGFIELFPEGRSAAITERPFNRFGWIGFDYYPNNNRDLEITNEAPGDESVIGLNCRKLKNVNGDFNFAQNIKIKKDESPAYIQAAQSGNQSFMEIHGHNDTAYLDIGAADNDYNLRLMVKKDGSSQIECTANKLYYSATEHIFNGIIKANNGIEVNNAPLRVNALFNYDEIYNNKRYLWMGWTFSDGGGGKGESGKECKNCTDVNDAWDNIKWDKHDKHGTFDENISIISKGGIAATCFVAHSDKRIKKNRALQNSEMSKNIISQIEIVSYTLKDSINLGNRYKLGVIAQELEKIFPDAVSKITDFIPDIYQLAKIVKCDNEAKTLTLTVDSLNELKVGDKVRIISETQQYEVFVSAINGTTITVKDWTEKDTKKAFVYGKEVNDFRVVDYDRIFTLNVSATQALISKVETLEEQVAKLQKENDILRGGNSDMLKRLDMLESSVKSLFTATKATAPSNNPSSGSPKK